VEQLLNKIAFLNVAQWDHAAITLMRVALIAVAAWIALGVTQRLIRLFRERITRGMDDAEQVKRADTLGRVFRYVAAVVVLVIAVTLILGELGVAVAPILGAQGCIGALSAEIRGGGEASESVQALAAIVAAQLAGVLAAPPAESSDARAAASS